MKQLKNNFTGRQGERIPHDWLNTIANFFNTFGVVGGGWDKREDGRNCAVIIPPSMGDEFLASFIIFDTAGTICFMEPGTFFRDSAPVTIIDLPATIQCPGDLHTWLRFDTRLGTCQWAEGTTTPASAGTVEIYPVHAIASDGTNIGTIHHEHPANFHTGADQGLTENYQIMGTMAEHADSAASDTWTAGGTLGLKIPYVDVGYDHTAGTPRIYAVKRQGTYDRWGKLQSVQTETIVEIDQPISHALLGT